MIYVKKSITKFIKHICNFDCGIVVEVSENLLGEPVLYVARYLPPQGSGFYARLHTDGISILEEKLNELRAIYPNHLLIVSGDLNARTKDYQDFILDDSPNYIPLPDFYSEDSFVIKRKSKDVHGELNEHGKGLLNLCCTYDIHLLNGRAPGDQFGELTCFTGSGCSLVDYTIVSTALYEQVVKFEIGDEDQYTHLPQIFAITSKHETSTKACETTPTLEPSMDTKERLRFRWTSDSIDKLLNTDQIAVFYNDIENRNCDIAIKTLVELLQDISRKGTSRQERKG